MPVKIPTDWALIVRKEALAARSIERSNLLAAVESDDFYDEDSALVVVGPLWPEAAEELIRRLKALGLEYVDDFFEIGFDRPDWLQLSCAEGVC